MKMTKSQDELKKMAAEYALKFIQPDIVVGVGTGSTVNFLIEELVKIKGKIRCCVSSSNGTTERLKAHDLPVEDLNNEPLIDVYIDGADEINEFNQMIKGGGGALTREKIISAAAKKFICIVDETKCVKKLGAFPLPVSVIPMARSFVARELVKMGGQPIWREGFITDNSNVILDVHNMDLSEPMKVEEEINQITGVVTNGLFAHRGADVVLVATQDGVVER